MKRTAIVLGLTTVFAGCSGAESPTSPTDFAPGYAVIKVERPALETTVCVNGSNQMEVSGIWTAQIIEEGPGLTYTATFKGRMLPATQATQNFVGPYPASGFATMVVNPFVGSSGVWSEWSSIGLEATGAFSDRASTIRQPKEGWPSC